VAWTDSKGKFNLPFSALSNKSSFILTPYYEATYVTAVSSPASLVHGLYVLFSRGPEHHSIPPAMDHQTWLW